MDDEDEDVSQQASQGILWLGLMAAAGCFLTIGNVIVQYANQRKESSISTYEILFIRSLLQVVLVVAFMVYGKVSVYGKSLRNLIVLIVMGIAEVNHLLQFCKFAASLILKCIIGWIFLIYERSGVPQYSILALQRA